MFKEFNNTITPYPSDKTLVDLFEEQVIKTPDNIALRWGNATLTYSELNIQSNLLADYLLTKKNVLKGNNIGILVTRSPFVMIGMLGILKSGCAYVPIDPEYPVERQKYIIENSKISAVLHNLPAYYEVLKMDLDFIDISHIDLLAFSSENPQISFSSNQLAYTIYTSGSTGRPKGVMIMHHSAVNLIKWVNTRFQVDQKEILLFITSICFDLSVYDIFGMLSSGGSIVIAEQDQILDLAQLAGLLKTHQVTFWDSVPTTLDFLIRSLESKNVNYQQTELRLVFLSGDWIPLNLYHRIKKFFPNAEVISLGGATEATVWSNYYPITHIHPEWKSIPYGKPIDNNFFYILDEQLNTVPNGEQGELYIGGVGVAVGYANDLEKTNHSFIKDPFNKECGGIMYKTGDLGRMMEDGNMEFLGRKDQQVKIRGFRVELGEIESVIRKYPLVDQVIILAKDLDGVKRLLGYIVPKPGYNHEDMLQFIRKNLPDYMVPALWMQLTELPVNANNKIDRNALPDIIKSNSEKELITPRNQPEADMAHIWKQVLEVSEISMDDNFFDLGGQSLIAVELISEVEKKFKIKMPISILFKYPTIEALVKNIAINETNYQSLIPIKASGSKIPLYIVAGDGINIINFKNLADNLDKEQPVYSLQPRGIDHKEEIKDETIEEIATHYVNELIQHHPSGNFAISGHSFGGYVAVEIKHQLEKKGRQVTMFGIFDTDANNILYKKDLKKKIGKKIKRQLPKYLFILKSFYTHPKRTLKYQQYLFLSASKKKLQKLGVIKEPKSENLDNILSLIGKNNEHALERYQLNSFKGHLHLFKAKERLYFIDDQKYLGWSNLAIEGISVYDIPGDHKTIFHEPNVKILATQMQAILDQANN
jgi:amino acid adenylation domain-containing protein